MAILPRRSWATLRIQRQHHKSDCQPEEDIKGGGLPRFSACFGVAALVEWRGEVLEHRNSCSCYQNMMIASRSLRCRVRPFCSGELYRVQNAKNETVAHVHIDSKTSGRVI